MQKVCIVIPCYNEALRLPTQQLLHFASAHSALDFVLVNDGSTDNTQTILDSLAAQLPSAFYALHLSRNQGKAQAIRSAVLASPTIATQRGVSYSHIGYWDADLATPLDEIPFFIARFAPHAPMQYVMGSRIQMLGTQIKRKTSRHYLGRLFATVVSRLLQLPVYDTQCGAKLIEANLAQRLFQAPFNTQWLFDVELLARLRTYYTIAEMHNIIAEQPLKSWQDVAGSKLRLKHMLGVPWQLWQIARHYRPTFK